MTESEPGETFRVISLPALVRMKLSINRDVDRTRVRDFIEVGLVDQSWTSRLPEKYAYRYLSPFFVGHHRLMGSPKDELLDVLDAMAKEPVGKP